WETKRRPDLTNRKLEEALLDLFSAEAGPDDSLLFYFSGHGLADNNASYLCSTDTNAAALSWSALSDVKLHDVLQNCPAAHKTVILDCCQGARIRGSAFEDLDPASAVIVATQGLAADGTHGGALSRFTSHLVAILEDPEEFTDDGLDVAHLVASLERRDAQT